MSHFSPCFEALESRIFFAATALLPDLVPVADARRGYLYNWSIDTTTIPGRKLLRLSNAAANVGAGPLELIGGAINSNGTQQVYQRVHYSDGSHRDRLAGNFVYHAAHHHTHFEDFARYALRLVTSSTTAGAAVAGGVKTSFCLEDVDPYNLKLAGAAQKSVYTDCGVTKQGISVGWADVYRSYLEGQTIDITNVADGRYWLETAVDPRNRIAEAHDGNNTARIAIDVHGNDDSFASAFVVGALAGTKSFNEFVGDDDPRDYYKFTVSTTSSFNTTLSGLSGDADVQLIDAKGNVIQTSSRDGTVSDSIAMTLKAGTYAVRVYQFDGDTTYKLTLSARPQVTLVAAGSSWKYLDNGKGAPADWRSGTFNDSGWASGRSQLGFGDGDEATTLPSGSVDAKPITTYFRRSFDVTDPLTFSTVDLRLMRDDGAVVYVNGSEVFRSNMPGGTITPSTLASTSVSGAEESAWQTISINRKVLLTGRNTIAVEIHQAGADSSDLSFDLAMAAVGI